MITFTILFLISYATSVQNKYLLILNNVIEPLRGSKLHVNITLYKHLTALRLLLTPQSGVQYL